MEPSDTRVRPFFVILMVGLIVIKIFVSPLFGTNDAIWRAEELERYYDTPWWFSDGWVTRNGIGGVIYIFVAVPIGLATGVLSEFVSSYCQAVKKPIPVLFLIAFGLLWLSPALACQLMLGGFIYWGYVVFLWVGIAMGIIFTPGNGQGDSPADDLARLASKRRG